MKITREQIEEVVALLCCRFPKCFDQRHRRPLKIGIREDIEAVIGAEIDEKLLAKALWFYTNHDRYRASLKVGQERRDLDGEAAGIVTEAEAAQATAQIRPKPKPDPVEAKRAPEPPPRRDGLAALKEAARRRRDLVREV